MTRPRRSSGQITKPRQKRAKKGAIRPRKVPSNKASLLTLPDEPLTQIITLLSKQTPSLHAPPAFNLAQTNTRFLNIFSSVLTRVTPYTSNPTLSTLSCTHLAAVSRIAGKHLRVIHLPEGALWPELADDCPNIEQLLFRDDWRSANIVRHLFRRLPLKILQVYRPCVDTLFSVKRALEKLVLKDVCTYNIKPLLSILKRPPKELVLQLDDLGDRRMTPILNALERAIPKMEKVSISFPSSHPSNQFHEDVRIMVKQLRDSGRHAKCKTVSLSGTDTFPLLRYVDYSALVMLSHGDVEYRSNPGEECYAVRLALLDSFPEVDIRHLEELTLLAPPKSEWLKRLPRSKHVQILCENLLPPVITDIATLPIPVTPYDEWHFLPTRELRFIGRHLSGDEVKGFCETIRLILNKFTGNVVWMEFVRGYDIPLDRDCLRRYVRCAKYSCESFEQEGGDAGSVLSWLDDVFGRCF